MTKSVYIKSSEGAIIWLSRGYDKFKQECDEERKRLMQDLNDEDLDEQDC